MSPYPYVLRSEILLKSLLVVLMLILIPLKRINSQTVPMCGHDQCLNYLFGLDNELNEKSIQYENFLANAIRARKQMSPSGEMMPPSGQDDFIIPIVFHVVHEGANTISNIPYTKIQHQIEVLNQEYGGQTNGIDVNIRFCLAKDPWPFSDEADAISWTNPNEPGVMRYENIDLSNHNLNVADENMLMALTNPNDQTFSFDNYLNIWVVSRIEGEAVFGYAPNPLGLEVGDQVSGIEGVIIRSDVIGDIDQSDVDMYAYFNHGNVLVHEIGHYLRLYHTFWQGCSGIELSEFDPDWCVSTGDFVCDTPPEILFLRYCFSDESLNSCVENYSYNTLSPYLLLNPVVTDGTDGLDHIENFMNYTEEDNCMKTFTYGQRDRMIAFLMDQRSTLYSTENLQNTGVLGENGCLNSILSADIFPDSYIHCFEETFVFTTSFGEGLNATNWQWDFGDGSTPVLTDLPEVTHTYSGSGNYVVTLIATNDQNVSLENSVNVIASACGDIQKYKANWLFGEFVSVDFSTGVPIPTDRIYNPPIMATGQGTTCVNDPNTGELLFYSNGLQVWNANNELISDQFIGTAFDPDINPYFELEFYSNSNKRIVCVPFPNHPNEFYLIRTRAYEESGPPNNVPENTVYLAHIDMNANGGQGAATYLGTLPSGPAEFVFEGISAVRHNNGKDYWILIPQSNGGLATGDFLVYLLTENGFSNRDFTSTQWLDPDGWQPSLVNSLAGDHNKVEHGYSIEMGEDQLIYRFEFDANLGVF
jgi:PKD repeat protein